MDVLNKIHVGYKIKLYPTEKQIKLIKRYFGACRKVYNLATAKQLDYYKENDKYISNYNLRDDYILPMIDGNEELSYLRDFDREALVSAIFDCGNACMRHKKNIANPPKFKSKKNFHQQYKPRYDRISIKEGYLLSLPKFSNEVGLIKMGNINYPEIIGNGNSATKSEKHRHYCNPRIEYDGLDYYISFSLELDIEEGIVPHSYSNYYSNPEWQEQDQSGPIGIDLGCSADRKNWAVDSKENVIERPDQSKYDYKIAKLQAIFNHKYEVNTKKGLHGNKKKPNSYTKNELKILARINYYFKKITNMKMDVIHKYGCQLLREKPQYVVMEDISVKDIFKSNKEQHPEYSDVLNKNVKDSMLYTFRDTIIKKLESNGIPVIKANKEYPSSQICHCCGYLNPNIGSAKEWTCPHCGAVHNRDENAAINLSRYNENYFISEDSFGKYINYSSKISLVSFY